MDKLLWYKKPTEDYMEGLPIGNGRLAAMALGLPEKFRLALNHEWLWRGENRQRDCEDVSAHLPEVRRLLLAGKFDEGMKLANDYFGGKGGLKKEHNRVDPYEPAGDLFVTMDTGKVSRYTRALDIGSGLSSTEFDCDRGHVVESAFASFSDDIIAVRIESTRRGTLNAQISRIADAGCTLTYESRSLEGALEHETIMRGSFARGISFAVSMRVTSDGNISATETGCKIDDASDTVIMLQIGTDAKGRPADDELVFPQDANFGRLFERHYPEFIKALGTTSIEMDLPTSEKPTDERIQDFKAGNDPEIPMLYFEYGRYIMASGSSGELPLNLQGKWNELIAPPWESDYHMDINLEMFYWFADALGMQRAGNTLFNLAEHYMPHGKEMARKLYGCDGIWFAIQTDVWGRMTPESYGWAVWIGAAPWMAQHFYDHWLYTKDMDFLRSRAYPFIRETARFYATYIIEHEGKPCIVPSQSPENRFKGAESMPSSLCADCAMDLELAHGCLSEAAELAELLGADGKEAARWRELDARLPWPGVDSKGCIIEFDKEREEVEPGHRHLSPMIGLHPMRLFKPDSELWRASERLLDHRLKYGGGHTGWSRAWVACMMARLGRADDGWQHFISLITDFATISMLNLHPPHLFQIDGNMGGTAAICEMLVQSREDEIYLLNALPKQWPKGRVKDFHAMGDIALDFSWTDGKADALTLRCGRNASGALKVHVNGAVYEADLKAGSAIKLI